PSAPLFPRLSLPPSPRLPPTPTLFPYTTLFRSHSVGHVSPTSGLFVALSPGPSTLVYNHSLAQHVSTYTNLVVRPLPRISLDVEDRKSTRLNSSHVSISYAVFCLKKKML